MINSKKGFTLIELLAVIVILAIILAVAVPSILGLIDSAQKNSFKSSVSMALEQGRLYQLNNTIGSGKTLTEIGLTVGSLNSSGRIKEENNILLTDVPAINNGSFCVVPGTSKNDLSNNAVATVRIQACKTSPSQGEVACNLCDVDITAPTNVSLTIGTVTSKSIEVIASGIDAESDITSYAFSKDNGSTWSDGQASNVYVFTNLNSGTYHIKVRIYNSVNMFTDSSTVSQATSLVNTPTYSVTPTSGWASTKTVTIDFQATNYTKEYSIDGGDTWTTSTTQTKEIVFNAPGNVIARITDGTNTIIATTYNVTQIDTTAPTLATLTIGTVTSSSIEVIASGTDDESGIVNYAFSKDNGTTWTMQASNTYIFTGLTSGTYQIKIRVYNAVDMMLESSKVDQQTITVNAPTYSIVPASGWAASKTVTIDYQITGYTKEYSIDGGSTWTTSTTQTKAVVFNAPGNVIARITDGTNTITATTYNVTQIDVTAPTVAASIGTITDTSIQVIGTGTDDETGISTYAFSKDNGATWTAPQGGNTYNFTGLTAGTIYQIKVRATNTLGSSTESLVYSQATTYIFAYTGGIQNWSMPMTGTAKIEVWGAQGGGTLGGLGGYSSGMYAATAGQTLNIYVGGQGATIGGNKLGGFNGGGNGGNGGNASIIAAGGGGASDVRIGGTTLANRVIVGAGGGGTSAWTTGNLVGGGNAGGNIGQTGVDATPTCTSKGGAGGTQSAGGTGGAAGDGSPGGAGSQGQGGIGANNAATGNAGGGGGGNGLSGGVGSSGGGGGGGSSFISTSGTYTLLNPQFQSGAQTGNGVIKITITTGFMATISAVTDTSIQVVGIATDIGGGSYTYSFSKDNGAAWTAPQGGSTYTFSGLTGGTFYQIKARATNTGGTSIDSRVFNQATSYVFTYTGAVQNWSMPITGTAKIEAWGGQGGNSANSVNSTGKGGYATGNISLTSATQIYIYVGGAGGNGVAFDTATGKGGWNGGEAGGWSGTWIAGGGGGSSDVRLGGTAVANRVIVGAGGGGIGDCGLGGGQGGGSIGLGTGAGTAYGGSPGILTSGGSGGNSVLATGNGGAGIIMTGGAGGHNGSSCQYGGGGGGGGYYGGGGGGCGGSGTGAGGGGGGSSYVSTSGTYTLLSPQFQDGVQTGNGLIKITIQ